MKLKLQFGLIEPAREVNWWQTIKDFPTLISYKSKKWEFVIYNTDDTKQFDYICHFSEVQTYDPNWHATMYYDLENLLKGGQNSDCQCGAAYSGFGFDHMRFCPKWTKW